MKEEEFDYFEDKLYDERVNQQEERMKESKEEQLTKQIFDIYWHFPEMGMMYCWYRERYWYLHPKTFIQIVEDYLTDCEDEQGALHDLINGDTEDFFQTLVEDTIH